MKNVKILFLVGLTAMSCEVNAVDLNAYLISKEAQGEPIASFTPTSNLDEWVLTPANPDADPYTMSFSGGKAQRVTSPAPEPFDATVPETQIATSYQNGRITIPDENGNIIELRPATSTTAPAVKPATTETAEDAAEEAAEEAASATKAPEWSSLDEAQFEDQYSEL